MSENLGKNKTDTEDGVLREEWREIREFPQFAISSHGNVLNQRTGRERKVMRNAQGVAMVTLAASGRILTRGVALLVAGAFIPNEEELVFRTPINLDGNRMNCRADNLMWRPRWFAVKFHRQFFVPDFHQVNPHLQIVQTGETFIGVKEPVSKYGLYYIDIFKSADHEIPIFPTRQVFRFV